MANAAQAFDEIAASYDATRRRLIPPFQAFYGAAVDALRLAGAPVDRVLDVGAGTGMLSAFVRAALPDARLTLLDGAPQMLDRAREALGADGALYVDGDLRDALPAGPWDAIVSALAIHHLPDAAKRDVYRRIHAGLRHGGVFVNAEHVAAPTPLLEAEYDRWHEASARAAGSDDAEWAHAVEMMRHDERVPVAQQLAWLREAGFAHTDCVFKDHSFAVLVAVA